MKAKALLAAVLVSIALLPCYCIPVFAECGGDLDCDGVVDGFDLATFAADYGRTDCPSGPLTLLGTVTVRDLETTDIYGLSFGGDWDEYGQPRLGDVRVKLVSGLLIPQLILLAAQPTPISRVWVDVAGENLLFLTDVVVESVNYLPPKHAADPYLVEVTFSYVDINLSWGGNHSNTCSSPTPDPDMFTYAHTVGFMGSLPEGPEQPVVREVTDFGFAGYRTEPQPLQPSRFSHTGLRFTRSLDSDAPCWFGAFVGGQHLEKFTLQKWGALSSSDWESKIYGEDYEVSEFQIDSSSGEIQQTVSLHVRKVRWTHRIFDQDGKVIDDAVTGWDFGSDTPW
jgi:type VI protein secretion system component Hcp